MRGSMSDETAQQWQEIHEMHEMGVWQEPEPERKPVLTWKDLAAALAVGTFITACFLWVGM